MEPGFLNDVTVIVPVYNGQRYIKAALDSVLSQVGDGCPRVTVVNDGSTDATPELLAEFGNKICRFDLPNRGQASALNSALQHVTTEFVAYLDADDISEPNRLLRQLSILKAFPHVGMVYTDRYIINDFGIRVAHSRCNKFDMVSIYQANPITRSSVMHRSKIFHEIGGFDTEISGNDDWDMWIRIAEKFQVYHLEEPLVNYRVHSGNLSVNRKKASLHNRRCKVRILEKTSKRSGPQFIRFMLWRAKVNAVLFKGEFAEGNFWFWNRFDRLQEIIEYHLVVAWTKLTQLYKEWR
jgi:glycosyltransferase involved in cell wall biosynthesis